MINVYLCGGLVTNWQQDVMDMLHDAKINFYNPMGFDITGEYPTVDIYGPMDRVKIEDCDVIFAFLEASNPTCINVVGECMYAKGLGKKIVLVNEWNETNYKNKKLKTLATNSGADDARWFKPRYLELFLSWCDFVVEDLGIGVEILRRISEYETE
jgi:hypothetical protein